MRTEKPARRLTLRRFFSIFWGLPRSPLRAHVWAFHYISMSCVGFAKHEYARISSYRVLPGRGGYLGYYVESPTRSGERPTFTSLHNARPHTYLNRGWCRSNAAQKSMLRGVTPPQTRRLRQERAATATASSAGGGGVVVSATGRSWSGSWSSRSMEWAMWWQGSRTPTLTCPLRTGRPRRSGVTRQSSPAGSKKTRRYSAACRTP